MALPEKDYYYLQELAARWAVSGTDMRYYAEHGFLKVQTWLEETMVYVLRATRLQNGGSALTQIGVTTYKGYVVVEPEELRKIFSLNPQPVSLFKNPHGGDILNVHRNHKKPIVGIEDLVISKDCRDEFEKKHDISVSCREAAVPTPSFGGRPSVMHMILKEFSRRCAAGGIEASLQKEASYLAAWAAEKIDHAQTPTAKTIMNVLRADYRTHRQSFTSPAAALAVE